ncbi:hypothetical protein [Streptomyces phytophilus]|uniref:hypothetical protein n=1 Tax=Streptomyces phytophilus TaxID=722715 RepID=UPI0015F0CE3E|nr:hypothetical protein [Streptomyces phytophilus]
MTLREQRYQNGMRVPAIAPWTGEAPLPVRVTRRWLAGLGGEGLGYEGELPTDRHRGLLWERVPEADGEGRAQIGLVHGPRRRRAMNHRLCQVCFTPAAAAGEPLMFLVAGSRPITTGDRLTSPPIHAECAEDAVRDCPDLADAYSAAVVDRASSWGVAGLAYQQATLKPLPSRHKTGLTLVSYDASVVELRWILAVREAVTVHGCTPVRLDDLPAESEAAGALRLTPGTGGAQWP